MEDSSDLLLIVADQTTGLAALQRARLLERLDGVLRLDLRPAWSRRAIAWSGAASVLTLAIALAWPAARHLAGVEDKATAAKAQPPHIAGARVRIIPPAYTGQPAVDQSGLDIRAPEGARIVWTLSPVPAQLPTTLVFPGEASLPLSPQGTHQVGERVFTASALYRITADGLPRQPLHRLEITPDVAPTVRVLSPTEALTLAPPGQSQWTVRFEASDDYGVAPVARLRIVATKGEGENISSTERVLPLTGVGSARRKTFTVTLDLAREGLTPGSDLIVRLEAADNRQPAPHTVEGPSVILRRPARQALAEGLEGMAKQVMPVYFRSQRQIIIDTEALIAQRAGLSPDRFLERANTIGADQAQLRQRYGQFMGDEAEGGGTGGAIELPTADAPALDLPTNDSAPAPEPAHRPDDGHDHGHDDHAAPDPKADGFGDMGDVVAQYGHAHDTGDAATLFDPGARTTLRQVLDAMWDSERALRQGKLNEALPHAHRALTLLKQLQQATRIFLARTAPKPPELDLSRRLTGKREGLSPTPFGPAARPAADSPASLAWRALGDPSGRTPLDLGALTAWVRANPARTGDPLALAAAIDAVRGDPACRACRARLRGLLWAALERPPAGVDHRAAPDARGRRYLEAIR